jgi:hypothetical protein
MTNRILLPLIVFCVLFTSCSTRKIDFNSYSHPDFSNKKYESIAVYYDTDNINHRTNLESVFVDELTDGEVNAVQGSILLPPIEEWSNEEKQRILKDKNIDGFITFELNLQANVDSGNETESDSELYPFKVTTKNNYDNDDDDDESDDDTKYSLTVKLIDFSSNKIAWQGKFDPFYLKFLEKGRRKLNSRNMVRGIIDELEAKGHLILD